MRKKNPIRRVSFRMSVGSDEYKVNGISECPFKNIYVGTKKCRKCKMHIEWVMTNVSKKQYIKGFVICKRDRTGYNKWIGAHYEKKRFKEN